MRSKLTELDARGDAAMRVLRNWVAAEGAYGTEKAVEASRHA